MLGPGANRGWVLILMPQPGTDLLPCLRGSCRNSVLCGRGSESFRCLGVSFVVLLPLASRGFLQFLAEWGSPTWLFASLQPRGERHSSKMDAKDSV